mgnify:CR=1 FL=1
MKKIDIFVQFINLFETKTTFSKEKEIEFWVKKYRNFGQKIKSKIFMTLDVLLLSRIYIYTIYIYTFTCIMSNVSVIKILPFFFFNPLTVNIFSKTKFAAFFFQGINYFVLFYLFFLVKKKQQKKNK